MKSFLCLLAMASSSAFAASGTAAHCDHNDFQSPFIPTAKVDVCNSHNLDEEGRLVRGMEPRAYDSDEDPSSQFLELKEKGFTHVLIFKNSTGHGQVEQEIEELTNREIEVKQIPFLWKNKTGDPEFFKKGCKNLIRAMVYMRDALAKDENNKVFFHCTVGEDRTGALAGLIRILDEDMGVRDAFEKEMCPNGYAAGNPYKPAWVVKAIRRDLTPTFLKMAYKIKEIKKFREGLKKVKLKNVEKFAERACSFDPEDDDLFMNKPVYHAGDYRCEPSTKEIDPVNETHDDGDDE